MATDPERPGEPAEPQALPATAEAVLTFLESVGRRSEAELYLGFFQRLPKESFAIIAPGSPVLRIGPGSFAEQLKFLADLGLSAPIVLGLIGSTPARAALERLERRLTAAGIQHALHPWTEEGLGDTLREELRRGVWPIVEVENASALSAEERVRWVGGLASELDTRKLVLLRRHGPLHLSSERSLSLADKHALAVDDAELTLVNLSTDADLVLEHKLLRREDARLLELARELLVASTAPELQVSITSPLDLSRELFTVKGAGTLIKRGRPIRRAERYEDLDLARLTALLESSFGFPVREEFFSIAPAAIFYEQDYRGAAIVHPAADAPYLAKFAVVPLAQGEGLGRDLWQTVEREFPRLFWRTRAANPVAGWYSAVCDGLIRLPRWHVFWRGLEPEAIPRIVEHAVALGDDFVREPSA